MKKIEVDIVGMHCASCSTIIEKTLNKKEGVKATVNLTTNKASVNFDEKTSSEKEIIESINKRGYGASIASENEDLQAKQDKEIKSLRKKLYFSLSLAIPAFIVGMVFMWMGIMLPYHDYILWALATPIQFYIGWTFYKGAWAALKNKSANMDTLVVLGTSAAYIFSVYAVLFQPSLGQYFETSAILITLILLGKYLETVAKGKTSEAIKKLVNLSPKQARVLRNGEEVIIPAQEVLVGDLIIIKPGEKLPVDGEIIEGNSSIDESMITGESIPVDKKIKDKVFAATINKNSTFTMKATKIGKDTTLAQIVKLVEDAQGSKAPIQRFADVVSSYFVPIVILIALATFSIWFWIFNMGISFSILTSVAVLVIACPCALGLATPTAVMVGTGMGAGKGILIKGAESLETAGNIKIVVFDKTGTITKGSPQVTDFESKIEEKEFFTTLKNIESKSEHPLAKAIVNFCEKNKAGKIVVDKFEALPGFGVSATIKKQKYFVGNPKLVEKKGLSFDKTEINKLESQGKTVMILFTSKKILGTISVADVKRPESEKAIKMLKGMGITPYLLTGDNKRTANTIAKEVGIKNVIAEVLPQGKEEHIRRLQELGKVAMVGDGINDAPALAQADIGIAMGSGTDVAMETGDIVLMQDNPEGVARAIRLSRLTMKKIKSNMFWSLFYNVISIPIAAGALYFSTGWLLSPMIAGAAMALSSVSVVTNSLMLKRKYI